MAESTDGRAGGDCREDGYARVGRSYQVDAADATAGAVSHGVAPGNAGGAGLGPGGRGEEGRVAAGGSGRGDEDNEWEGRRIHFSELHDGCVSGAVGASDDV